ncbi:hypothetical protein SEVIR_5G176300v4 [Setaria viridis]|uniref:Uncharacterized protein n=3 Tax=Setaria TaxID=4554 RepID=A0A368R5S7_SETIT|nr:uncharacterized protein LOC101780830 [Setaria italica]XP_034596699.1 uncharacterized protein LOC117857904 [Setaria viridis]RCV25556.1 hypothetical protein SETIT_5G176000v2 [Setaria italica]TKW14550.1 hypothetical protein SEVIR_5G176300v2 [Setaria viridis]
MATEVCRPHNILLPAPHRIRPAASSHRRPSSNNPAGGATRRSPPACRRHHGRKAASRPAAEVYAGPAFSTSPEPSALPLPQFPVKKAAAAVAAVDDAATRDLRRILRLE